MRFHPLLLLVPLTCASFAYAADVSPNDFAYGAALSADGQSAAYQFDVPLNVYRHVVYGDLRDIGIFNSDGHSVSFAVRRRADQTVIAGHNQVLPMFPLQGDVNRSLAALRLKIEAGGASLDVRSRSRDDKSASTSAIAYVIDARVLQEPISALELQWPQDAADYSGHIKLETSEDLSTWHELTRAPIVNLHFGGEQLIRANVECPSVSTKFLRLTWEDAPPPFTLTRVVGETAVNRVDIARSFLAVKGLAGKGAGVYEYDLGAAVPVDRIDLQLPYPNAVVRAEILSRANTGAPWASVVTGHFYRLRNAAQDVRSAAVNVPVRSDRYWRVQLLANSTLDIPPGLRVGWVPHRVVFVATGTAPFEIAFGRGAAQLRSVPISTLIPGWRESTESSAALSIGTAEVLNVHDLGGAQRLAAARPSMWRTSALWAALLVAVGLLGWMAYRLLQDMRRAQ